MVLAAALAVVSLAFAGEGASSRRDVSLDLESKAAVWRAMKFLESCQKANGSWCDSPPVTALVVSAMLSSGEEDFGPGSAVVGKALGYVRGFAQPDGGIYDKVYPNYSTSVCAVALLDAGLAEDKKLLQKARTFLADIQADESEDISPANPQYGGWGYEKDPAGGGMHPADMSNTQFALEALKSLEKLPEEGQSAAGGAPTCTELAYGRAIAFLQRCQNLQAVNDQPWASNDGGFVYGPTASKAGPTPEGGLRSYGSMTYAGLKSMVYARLAKGDRRVQSAYDWVRMHWTVTENPGLGRQGLYYYYMTMAKALSVYGSDTIVDAEGRSYDWRKELISQLLKVQRADGSWANDNGRWMEQMPELATSYAIMAIEDARKGW
jgi:squalene-hopene/tetraprenyl-beta-curcumene cyclase